MANNVNNGITGVIDIPGALRSRGAADGNLVGGVVAYAGDIYDVTLDKNLAEVNSGFTEAIDDINDNISSIQDDISPFTRSANLQSLVEYDKIEVSEGINASQHNEVYINDKKLAMSFGYNNTISNDRKLAFGFGQQLDVPDNTFVIGQRNSYEPNAAFIVGNGTLNGSTNNAFVIGRDGNFWVYGINGYAGQLTGTSQYNSVNHFITGLDTRLTALEGITSSSSSAPTYSAGTGITISNDTISVDATQLSYNDLLDKLVQETTGGNGVAIYGLTMTPCDVIGGENGVAMGAGAIVADGYGAIAAGCKTSANGWGVSANGAFTYAEGSGAHVEGKGLMDSNAIIRESYTQGGTYIIVNQTFPVGAIILNKNRSAILCYVTNCEEYGSYYKLTLSAGLDQNLPTGKNIQIIGYAKGIGAHAEGCGTIAKGDGTHAEGMYTVTNNEAEHACGKYNKSTPEVRIPGSANVSSYGTQFSIGIGSSYTQRVNAFEVLGNGNIYVKGLGNYDGTSIANVDSLQTVITDVNTRLSDLKSAVLIGDNIVIATSPRSEFYSTNKGAEDNVIIGTASIEYTLLASEGSFKKNIIVGDGNKLNNCDRTAVSSSVIFGSNNNVTGGICIGVNNTNQSTTDKRSVFTLLGIRLKAGDSNNITYNYNFIPYATVIGVNNNPTTFNGIYSSYQNGDWTDAGAFEVGAGKNNTSVSILAQKSDGNLYIKGVGGWDGMSSVKNKKSINTIISEFETRIAALESQIAALTNN